MDEVEEHSTVCGLFQKVNSQMQISDERLKKVADLLQKKRVDISIIYSPYELILITTLEKISKNASTLFYDLDSFVTLNHFIQDLDEIFESVDENETQISIFHFITRIKDLLIKKCSILEEKLKLSHLLTEKNPNKTNITDFEILESISKGKKKRLKIKINFSKRCLWKCFLGKKETNWRYLCHQSFKKKTNL